MEITAFHLRNLPTLNNQLREEAGLEQQTIHLAKKEDSQPIVEKLANSMLNRPEDSEFLERYANQPPLRVIAWETRSIDKVFPLTNQILTELDSLTKEYEHMQTELARRNPGLAAKDFGFSVTPQGELMILERNSPLTTQETEYLNNWLNSSDQLKILATQSAQMMIEYTQLAPSIISNPDQTLDMHLNGEEKFRPPGRYNLNMDNFHTTIDLQQALHPYGEQPMSFFHGRWIDQLYSKGEVRPIEDIIQVIHPGISTKA